MKQLFILFILSIMTSLHSQTLNPKKILHYETALDDVMEIIGNKPVLQKLKEVENDYKENKSHLNTLRLGLIYHEVALNLTFFDKTDDTYAGYAQKSYAILSSLKENIATEKEELIYIDSYRASALSLVAAETRKLKLLGVAFNLFNEAVSKYADFSPRPEFMRGSVAENLPFFMWRKTKFAKIDFDSIIKKQDNNNDYADFRIMSFSYWAWARAHNKKKHRQQALKYLDLAISIDPLYLAGRLRAEELKNQYLNH